MMNRIAPDIPSDPADVTETAWQGAGLGDAQATFYEDAMQMRARRDCLGMATNPGGLM